MCYKFVKKLDVTGVRIYPRYPRNGHNVQDVANIYMTHEHVHVVFLQLQNSLSRIYVYVSPNVRSCVFV